MLFFSSLGGEYENVLSSALNRDMMVDSQHQFTTSVVVIQAHILKQALRFPCFSLVMFSISHIFLGKTQPSIKDTQKNIKILLFLHSHKLFND